jgi:hypothetical protein
LVRTLPESKKTPISSIRSELLKRGFQEELENDAINVEPVLIYSKSENDTVVVRFKWELNCAILVSNIQKFNSSPPRTTYSKFLIKDEDDRFWMKFNLPENETEALGALDSLSSSR